MTNPIIITKTISVDGFLDERNREIFDENDFNGMKNYLYQEDLDDYSEAIRYKTLRQKLLG